MGWRRAGRPAVLAGAACAGAFAFASPASAADRAYELVTPVGSNIDIRLNHNGIVPNTPDGNRVCYVSSMPATPDAVPFPPGGTMMVDAYCAHRTASGWVSEWISQPRGRMAPSFGTPLGAGNKFLSNDGQRAFFISNLQIDPATYPNDSREATDGYVREGGTTTLITGPRAAGSDTTPQVPVAVTPDGSHALLTDLDGHVRVWSGGAIEIVSRDADGNVVEGRAPLFGSGPSLSRGNITPSGALSRDGSQVFFHANGDLVAAPDDDGPEQSVYVRDGSETQLVSKRTGNGTPADIRFVGAGDDGRLVYLHTTEQLTAEPITGDALYRYDRATDETVLVADEIGTGIEGQTPHPYVQEVSGDGSAVFYIGADNTLYRWRSGVTTALLALSPEDFSDPAFTGQPIVGVMYGDDALRVTRDGSVAVFSAYGDTPGVGGVYRWSEADGLQVLSRDAGGNKVRGGVGQPLTPFLIGGGDLFGWGPWGQYMTDDGTKVYFHTPAALVPSDTNAGWDVYEWAAGQLRLLSPGDQDHDAYYVGNSADGSTVFFNTRQRILPNQDTNSGRDLYAARVGSTGFPDPAPSPVGTPPGPSGPAGPGATPPVDPPTTAPKPPDVPPAVFTPVDPGDDGPSGGERATVRVASAGLAGDGRAVRVRVRASTGGEVSVALRRRGDEVASSERSVDGPGRTTVRVPLPANLRERLSRGRAVRLAVVATLSPADGGDEVRDRSAARLRAAGDEGDARRERGARKKSGDRR